ncbi:hypothetical protein V7128_01965 [Neobacillus vireti]|uniref:hypothetical protein n=1 Tax=Neobacillus vireti TaxID=220686 RepID=UPI002FFFC709
MKLWLCSSTSDDFGLHVAETKGEAIQKFVAYLDKQEIWYTGVTVTEVKEVDGYEILVKKKNEPKHKIIYCFDCEIEEVVDYGKPNKCPFCESENIERR